MVDDHEKYPRGAGADKIEGGKLYGRNDYMFEGGPHMLLSGNCHCMVEINPAAGTKEIDVELVLDGGQTIKGQVVDQNGKPVPTAAYSSKLAQFDGSWDLVGGDGSFEVLGYDPAKPRRLTFFDRERPLSATVVLNGPLTKPLVVTLQPSGGIKGRIVDTDGTPLPNMRLTKWEPAVASPGASQSGAQELTMPLPPSDVLKNHAELFADANGGFEMNRLVAGEDYRIRAFMHWDGKDPKKFRGGPLDVVVKVTPGQMLDLGDVKIADEQAYATKALESMKEMKPKPNP
jgi:hypothetical protein